MNCTQFSELNSKSEYCDPSCDRVFFFLPVTFNKNFVDRSKKFSNFQRRDKLIFVEKLTLNAED